MSGDWLVTDGMPHLNIIQPSEEYLSYQHITGWWFEPLWKIWKSVGMIVPNIWKNNPNVPVTTNQYRLWPSSDLPALNFSSSFHIRRGVDQHLKGRSRHVRRCGHHGGQMAPSGEAQNADPGARAMVGGRATGWVSMDFIAYLISKNRGFLPWRVGF